MTAWLRQNLGLKLFALFLAYVVWSWVVGRSPLVRVVNVAIDVISPADTMVLDFTPRIVGVRVEGDPAAVRKLNEADMIARVEAPRAEKHEKRTLTILAEEVRGVPSGVAVEIRDSQVSVVLEPVLTKTVGVQVRSAGTVPDGFLVKAARSEPLTVTVTGPESEVRALDRIYTEEIDLTGRSVSFAATRALVRPESHVRFQPDLVRVQVDIEAEPAEEPAPEEPVSAPPRRRP